MKCNAESNTEGVRCQKEQHGEDENHWGTTPEGLDVVWASITLRPPSQPKED